MPKFAGRYYIPGVTLTFEEERGMITQERLDELTEIVKAWPRVGELDHGDVVCFEESPYRNMSCFFWSTCTGKKLIAFDDVDEYGNVPREFLVSDTEFHPRYWQNAVAHNGIFWPAPEIIERIKFTRHADGSLRATLTIGTELWNCIVDAEPGAPEPDLKTSVFVAEDANIFEGDYVYETTFFVRTHW